MNAEEITAGLSEAARLPKGRLKSERLELLATAAKALGDRVLEGKVLIELSHAYAWGGEGDRSPLVFGRLLKIYDEFPAELGGFTHAIHWQLKWMTSALVHNPRVPIATATRWLSEFESRYRQRGYSPRPVHALRSSLALSQGDAAAASAAMEASIAAPRDQMANCDACERNSWGYWRAELGDDEGAIEFWTPVISGQKRCAEEPHRILGLALLPLVRLGRYDEARSAYLKGYPFARRNVNMRQAVGRHIEFCALTGNEARGLEILAEHANWLTNGQEDVASRYRFFGGAAVLLRRLVTLGYGEVPVGDGSASEVLATLEKELAEISAGYDLRNGNTFTSMRLAARLAQEPLIDWLPLGVSASLPQVAALVPSAPPTSRKQAPAAAEPWDAVRPTVADAERQLRDGNPASAEDLARQALKRGGTLIPHAAAAQLYSLLAEALRRQPERELDLIDAALKASARWDGISEPDMLHQRFVAAMTYRELGRNAEAVALLEDVIDRAGVPYNRLGVAQTRRSYGESLRALRRHREAAEQLLQAAALLQEDPDNERPYAEVAWMAAESLQNSGRREEALHAFERAATLWESLGESVPAVRCRRSIAWLVFQREPQRAVELMRAVLAALQESAGDTASATAPEELTELEETEKQLDRMVKQAEHRAKIASAEYDHDDYDYDEDDED